MQKKTKEILMKLPPESRARVINAVGKIVARRAKRNNQLLMDNESGNLALAIHWFEKAAAAGHASSMWGLVGAYEHKEDDKNALYWQIKAVEAGHEKAQRGLEIQHEHGDLESKIDDEQVFNWYVWSAEQGRLWAQLFLAQAYRCGEGVDQDDEQAAYWFCKAAEQGEGNSQVELGKMYEEGLGVEKNFQQATYWYRMAAEQEWSRYVMAKFKAQEALKKLGIDWKE